VDPDDLLGGAVIATGNCTLMRESVMQPGDVVTVKAVDQPKLRHLKNVIVFPVRGRMGRKPLPEL
jgi:RNA-dependent RNA polymerase